MHKSVYFPGLNGLRAIAALAVVISHTTQGLKEFGLDPFIFGQTFEGTPLGLELAGFGVSIFFTLSGFLITYLLLLEKETGSINIRNFYVRRVLRIWPLYYLYLSLALITIFAWDLPFRSDSLLCYTFLAANIPLIAGIPLPFLIHYWSLGVEEQFYALWPWLAKMETKKLLKVAVSGVVILLVLKFILKIVSIKYQVTIPYSILHITRFHCMLIGCIGAIYLYTKNDLFFRLTTNLFVQFISWVVLLIVALNRFHLASVFDNEIISVVALCLIMGQANKKNRIFNLENDVMDFLGKISFGIYVFHPLIIFYSSTFLGEIIPSGLAGYLSTYLLVLLLTIAVAWLSYQYYEKRFLRIKLQFSVIPSTSAKHF